ncbi:MAG: alpha/beta hydrolase fold domain-containing protein [Nocardioides sp.]|uniref:alpha/beta hydrolase fold domain-containing protein n=1 Tax=Nocardioides sp. TaxID=35761 RepID=UPI003F08740B
MRTRSRQLTAPRTDNCALLRGRGGRGGEGRGRGGASALQDLQVQVHAAVLNVEYALAPGHIPSPTAPEQAYDVLVWAASSGREWDGSRLTTGGQSAGAGRALAACRQAGQHGTPASLLQLLQYPPTDAVHPRTFPSKAMLRPWMLDVFDASYVPDPADRAHPCVSPAYGTNSAADQIAGIAPPGGAVPRGHPVPRRGCARRRARGRRGPARADRPRPLLRRHRQRARGGGGDVRPARRHVRGAVAG